MAELSSAHAAKETVLYSFKDGGDGSLPLSGLINVGGVLYGTTWHGGDFACQTDTCGTVFKITLAGIETVIHSFGGIGDGSYPASSLVNVAGVLYGTTTFGGFYGINGTVFEVTRAGAETVVHGFNGNDGDGPEAGLTNVGGTLYGTTFLGGANGAGTVFKIANSGAETVVYSFSGGTGNSDGAFPEASLINVAGVLFGTTVGGGANGDGTVFKVTKAGAEKVLYSFKGGADGSEPYGGLIDMNGVLYGTTRAGGAAGAGTVFKVSQAGLEKVIYSFKGGADGSKPYGNLISMNGVLYGSTAFGGASGDGTVFKVTKSGVETLVYSFMGGSDGANPNAGLIDVNGALYGTTEFGGTGDIGGGFGTVFKLIP